MKLLAIAKGITDRYVACSNLDNTPRASNFILGYCRECYMQHIYLLPFAMVKNRPLHQYLWVSFSSLRYPWHQNDLPASGLQCALDLWCSDLGTTSHDLLPLTLSTYTTTHHQSSLSGVTPVLTSSSISHLTFSEGEGIIARRCEILLEASTGITPLSDDWCLGIHSCDVVRRCKKLFGGDKDIEIQPELNQGLLNASQMLLPRNRSG